MHLIEKLRINLLPLILLLIIIFVIFYRLGNYGLFDWDEAVYADISRNVLRGNIFALKFGGSYWFQKPPLFFWLTAIAYKIFGISEFSSRFLSAISGVTLVCLLYLFTKKLFDKTTAIIVLIVTLLNSFLLFQFRFATTDVSILLLSILSIDYFWKAQFKKKYLVNSFALLGIGVMVKSAAILPVILFYLLFLLLSRQLKHFIKSKYFWIGIMTFFIIVLPWHIFMIVKFGYRFYYEYYYYQIFIRTTQPIENHSGNSWYYLSLIINYFPLSLVLFISPVIYLKSKIRSKSRELLFVGLWFVSSYIAKTVVVTKLPWYALQVIIPLQIIVAQILSSIIKLNKSKGLVISVLLVITALFIELKWPYYYWQDLTYQSAQKNCIMLYKQFKLEKYYVIGYDYSYPTMLFYLDIPVINLINDLSDAPDKSLIMVRKGYSIDYKKYLLFGEGQDCVFVKKR